MIPAIISATVVLVLFVVAIATLGLILARRVVSARPHPRSVRARFDGDEVLLPLDFKTVASGKYLLQPLEGGQPVVVDEVTSSEGDVVRRRLERPAATGLNELEAIWSAHQYVTPEAVGEYLNVNVPLRTGETREAWQFPGDTDHWVIHVQGIRTSRTVALRTAAAAHDAGATSLVITYRGSGDGPPARSSTLGAREWEELRDSVAYARANGAKRVTIAAWSMGAALTLEMLRHDPGSVDDLVLICPVSDWPATIAHGAKQAHLPVIAAHLAGFLLRTTLGVALLGLPGKVDVRRLAWTETGSVPVRTLIIHSQGDEVVPWASTLALTNNNPDIVTLHDNALPTRVRTDCHGPHRS